MNKKLVYWQVGGFVFTAVLGTLLHFFFDWTGGSIVAAIFSAVNESIWEHIKLLFYPMFLFAAVEYAVIGRDYRDFWWVKLTGSLLGLVLIPVLYYSYTGILGVSADWFNVTIFFIVAAVVFWVETRLFLSKAVCPLPDRLAFVLMCIIGVVFTVLTFLTPQIPLFADPITGTYGFQR